MTTPNIQETIASLTLGDASAIREPIRSSEYDLPTGGMAVEYIQANVVILPADLADQFTEYCRQNYQPCPLLAVTEPGSPLLPTLGHDIDLRTDIPRYQIFHFGEQVDEVSSISNIWNDDLVGFVLGCSFSFEHALLSQGIALRHSDDNSLVPMYITTVPTESYGPFSGNTVVTFRPINTKFMNLAIEITSRYPYAHGAPIHVGDPSEIGISDLMRPDWGTPVQLADEDQFLFWACGVTTQLALKSAHLPLYITHAPGHMLITDVHALPVTNH